MKRIYILLTGVSICLSFLSVKILKESNLSQVCAQGQSVQYSYDSLGRVSSAVYQDGTKIVYKYDRNGNLLSCEKIEPTTSDGSDTEDNITTEDSGNLGQDISNKDTSAKNNVKADSGQGKYTPGGFFVTEKQVVFIDSNYILKETKLYNKFKKRNPVIKSLKVTKSKKEYYLNIQIREIKGLKEFKESGYQIQYATNSKFKKAKSVKVGKKKKSSLTGKKWKVKKGKTYYVRVRAYGKTKKEELSIQSTVKRSR